TRAAADASRALLGRLGARVRPGLERIRLAADQLRPLALPPVQILDDGLRQVAPVLDTLALAERLDHDEPAGPQPVELAAVVRGAVLAAGPSVAERGQHLTVSLPLQPEWLAGDRNLLARALAGLLDNAARHSSPGARV